MFDFGSGPRKGIQLNFKRTGDERQVIYREIISSFNLREETRDPDAED